MPYWINPQKSRLNCLLPVLKKTLAVHRKYTKENHGDCTLWYRERPQIGLLAAAVWLCGGTALEEYVTRKKAGMGRCDLWIRLKTGSADFECEAKHIRLRLTGDAKDSADRVIGGLYSALAAAAELRHLRRLGLCFASVSIREKEASDFAESLNEVIAILEKKPQCHARVWIESAEPRKVWANDRSPLMGVLLVVSEETTITKRKR